MNENSELKSNYKDQIADNAQTDIGQLKNAYDALQASRASRVDASSGEDETKILAFLKTAAVPQDALYLASVWDTVVQNGYLKREFIDQHVAVISAASLASVAIQRLAAEESAVKIVSFTEWWKENKKHFRGVTPELIALAGYMRGLKVAGHRLAEQSKMANFISELFEDGTNDIDGSDLQDLGKKHGILIPTVHHEPCCSGDDEDDECVCAQVFSEEQFKEGVTCYRLADWLVDSATI
jgi:hypothetical protein